MFGFSKIIVHTLLIMQISSLRSKKKHIILLTNKPVTYICAQRPKTDSYCAELTKCILQLSFYFNIHNHNKYESDIMYIIIFPHSPL